MPEAIPTAVEPQKSLGEAIAAKMKAEVPEVAPQTGAEAVPAEVVAPKSILDRAREAGFDVNETDENGVLDRLFAALQDRDRQAQDAAERAARYEQLALLRAQQPVPQQLPATQPASAADQYAAPEVDLVALQFYRNEDGSWKPDAPLELKQQVQRYENHRKQWSQKLLDKPKDALQPLIDQIVEAKLAERMAAMEQTAQDTAAQTEFMAKHGHWLYTYDPVSRKVKTDPRTGEALASPRAEKFGIYLQRLDPKLPLKEAYDTAMKLLEMDERDGQQSLQATAQQAQTLNAQNKQDLLKRALPGPSQAGTFPTPTERRSQNPRQSLGEKVLAEMQRTGVFAPG